MVSVIQVQIGVVRGWGVRVRYMYTLVYMRTIK